LFQLFVSRLKAGGSSSLLTMFRLIERVAASLRHLFSFSVELVLQEARRVLVGGQSPPPSLLAATLACLTTVLTYSKAETTSTQQERRFKLISHFSVCP
jgi:hypothetical protein